MRVRAAGRRRARGLTLALAAAALSVVVQTGPALANAATVPAPPPNPSDSQINAAKGAASAKAAAVGTITSQLSAAQASLQKAQDQVELKEEQANKALVDLQTAQDAATNAQAAADSARIAANAAGSQIDALRQQSDDFVAGSFEQGSQLGSVSAYLTADSPEQLLERQELLNDISGSQLNVLDQVQVARTAKANADAMARAALVSAQQKQSEADAAKRTADNATAAAVTAQHSAAATTSQLQATQASLEQQLAAAQAQVGGLQAQRQQYQSWLAAKQAADAAASLAASRAAAARAAAGRSSGPSAPTLARVSVATGDVSAVVNRALSAVGITYAWGGGNANGPTRGIHDGGVADSYGDYNRIGFDCSGLMVYAFAGAGVSLPHFSGYQYQAGTHVPLSAIQPGDMLFWSFDGAADGIHHVALYIGNGQMVEAYESGTTVRVTSVRYYDGLMPYATRVL